MNLVNHRVVKHKLGLLNLAEELGNVSRACKIMGASRDTFYRYQEAKAEDELEALLHKDRRRKNRIDDAIEATVLAYALEQPAHGQVRVSNELRQRSTFVSPSGVGSIWLRHELLEQEYQARCMPAAAGATPYGGEPLP